MHANHVALFALYYAPLLPILLLAWLWALSVGYFERHGVQYAVCFSRADQAALPTSRQLASLAAVATLWYLTSAAVFSYQCVAGVLSWAALQPWMLYLGLLGGVVMPVNVLGMVRDMVGVHGCDERRYCCGMPLVCRWYAVDHAAGIIDKPPCNTHATTHILLGLLTHHYSLPGCCLPRRSFAPWYPSGQ